MNIPSLKKHIITSLAFLTDIPESDLNKNNVIVITAAGIIEGKIAEIHVDGQQYIPQVHTIPSMINLFAENYQEKYGVDIPTSGNDGYLALSNATIRLGSGISNLNNLVVFIDQIIGVTIGNIEVGR